MIAGAIDRHSQIALRLAEGYFAAIRGLTGVYVQPEDSEELLLDTFLTPGRMIAILDFTGSIIGFLAVSMDERTAKKLIGSTGAEGGNKDVEAEGLVKELLNSVSGTCVELLQDEYRTVTILAPKVVYGRVSFPKNVCLTRQIRTNVGTFWFSVSTDTMQLEVNRLIERLRSSEDANAAKSEFLANMSHEIRTPMNGILGMTELLLETELQPKQREYGIAVWRSADSLLTILNDILDFSKIEAGKLEIEAIPFDLMLTAQEVARLFASKAEEKDLQLLVTTDPETPRWLIGDPGRIRQILTNLVGNALKFTASGHVAIHVDVAKRVGDTVDLRFSVEDTGIGIPENRRDALFQKFSQADSSTTRRYGGTGLGLAISKQLAQLMGGDIGMTSEEGKGSTFWVTVRVPIDTERNDTRLPTAELMGVRCLIVQRACAECESLHRMAVDLGLDVVTCTSDREAVEFLVAAAADGTPFEIIVYDRPARSADGAKFPWLLDEHPELPPSSLVYVASAGRRGEARLFASRGYSAYLIWPLTSKEMRLALSAVHGARQQGVDLSLITRHTLREAHPMAGVRTDEPDPTAFPLHVLVVEDNEVNQKVAVRSLERLGCRVDVATNGEEAVRKVAQTDYDVVFMDCQMPVMDGFEATRRIRERPDRRDVPIVAMTANAMRGDKERCLRAGMSDYLSKPVKRDALRAALEHWSTNGIRSRVVL